MLAALVLAVGFAAEIGGSAPAGMDFRAGAVFARRHALLMGMSVTFDRDVFFGGELVLREYFVPLESGKLSPLVQVSTFVRTSPPQFGSLIGTGGYDWQLGAAAGFGGEVLLFSNFGVAALVGLRFVRNDSTVELVCGTGGCLDRVSYGFDLWSAVVLTFHFEPAT